jgi:hypothetical protein
MKRKIANQIIELAKSKFNPDKVQRLDLFEVDDKIANKFKESAGINISGYIHQIESCALRHALKRHGSDRLPITCEDFGLIPEIIRNFDYIKFGKTQRGLKSIIYIKRFNATIICIEELRRGKKRLSFKTMYKKTPSGASLGITPEAIRLSQNEMPTPNSVNTNLPKNEPLVNVITPVKPTQSTQGANRKMPQKKGKK